MQTLRIRLVFGFFCLPFDLCLTLGPSDPYLYSLSMQDMLVYLYYICSLTVV